MVRQYGPLFQEERKRKPAFNFLKGSYIVPTQVEACLAYCYLELDIRKDKDSTFDINLISASKFMDDKITEEKIVVDLRKVLFEFFSYILPWPKDSEVFWLLF